MAVRRRRSSSQQRIQCTLPVHLRRALTSSFLEGKRHTNLQMSRPAQWRSIRGHIATRTQKSAPTQRSSFQLHTAHRQLRRRPPPQQSTVQVSTRHMMKAFLTQ